MAPSPPSSHSGALPAPLLYTAAGCTLASVALSAWSILRHLYSYQRPALQRLVVRIMLMIPIYSVASLASLWSLRAAFFIDLVRDLYEAFVIYTFFTLLLHYLGGPRSLLTLLHSSLRPPTPHPFPFNLFLHPLDLSDPHSYLALKRGVLQYCFVKPVLAGVTVALKLGEVYGEGQIGVGTGYTWVSIVYNASICLSLYCLAMFWVTINPDVRPFRPTPKFLCVKGILFFSFWQAIAVGLLVKWRVVSHVGEYTDQEHISLALNNVLISLEMPLFAVAHTYAFCVLSDYVDPSLAYTARLPLRKAAKDAFGCLDLYFDFLATARGRGYTYRAFEPSGAEWGVVREGPGRERRLRDGLRYERGGKGKYWLPVPRTDDDVLKGAVVGAGYGATGSTSPPPGFGVGRNGHRPHAAAYRSPAGNAPSGNGVLSTGDPHAGGAGYLPPAAAAAADDSDSDGSTCSLEFPSADADGFQEALYAEARGYLHGDWAYVVIDVSKEAAKRRMREEEENVLRGYGRRGEGRREGERWGRGLGRGEAEGGTRGGKGKGKGKGGRTKGGVYGAWGGEDGPTEAYRDDPRPPSAGPSSLRPSPLPSPAPLQSPSSTPSTPAPEVEHPGPAAAAATAAVHLTAGLRAAAHKVVPPPPQLRFSTDEEIRREGRLSPADGRAGGSRSGVSSPGELPPDAVDLVVEDPDAWARELDRRRRKGEPARLAEDGVYWRAVAEREGERASEEGGRAAGGESRPPPLVHVSPPSSPSDRPAASLRPEPPSSPPSSAPPPTAQYPPLPADQDRSPWFSEPDARVSGSTTPVFSPDGDGEENPWH